MCSLISSLCSLLTASELSLAFGIQKVNMENYLSEFAGMAKNNVNVIMSYNDVIFFYVW